MNRVTGIVICKNEESNIDDCLKSIQWCDEIIIVDAFSMDNTVTIAKKYTDKIFLNEWKGFAEQRKFALSKANCDWIFSLDADERCSEELKIEIKKILSKEEISEQGFEIPRKSFFLNKWIRHGGWYPNYQLRLFRKESGSVTERMVHESYAVKGTTDKLTNNILHYTVTSIFEFVNRINKYSNLSAIEKLNKKKIGAFGMLFIPGLCFFRQYILKGNFLDGTEGIMVSKFHMMTKLLNNMKIWELQNRKS